MFKCINVILTDFYPFSIGSQPGDVCTANLDYGCRRMGTATNIINPIQSARLRSARGFSFKYGKVEIEAKMPTGDWLWPGNRKWINTPISEKLHVF